MFGDKLRIALVALVLVAAVVGAAFTAGIIDTPSVGRVDDRFGDISETATVIETDLYVSNPSPLSANLSGLAVDYGVEMNGIWMTTGEKEGVFVGQGTTAAPSQTMLRNEYILEWQVSHVRSGEHTDLAVNATISSEVLGRIFKALEITRSIGTDLLSAFSSVETSEINAESLVVSGPVLYVNETRTEWGESTDEYTALEPTFVVHNPKPYSIAVSEFGYDISMNSVTVDEGATNSEYVIPPRSTETIEATTHIQNDRLDGWWVTHLERDQTTDLHIDFYANLDAGDTTLRVPLGPLIYKKTFEMDIFRSKVMSDGSEATDEPTVTKATEAIETAESETATSTATTTSAATTTVTTATTPSSDDGTTTADDDLLQRSRVRCGIGGRSTVGIHRRIVGES